ncbi:CRISPR-associated protein [Salmonella enterica subsp. enterica serovar Alachua str. R6-377]|uniref:CRISPR-associated protein n=1 Tax=Salmonella enterica subsp. enterica serovar Alachua str. R6-377 TaxID=913241 RepID=G5LSY8_SALET|nr:CRISPR-associated protein [Salmonella enterica subsp. enterica serovar Alachua str. R6-377]
MLSAGQTLRFNLRANPTVCKNGKRHDLLMEAKRQRKTQGDSQDIWSYQQQAALEWLARQQQAALEWLAARQGEQNGFTLREASVDAYRQQQIRREKSRQMIQFSSVDYTGVLVINDPVLFLQRLAQGYGKSRAFGCGMMMIKPGDDA